MNRVDLYERRANRWSLVTIGFCALFVTGLAAIGLALVFWEFSLGLFGVLLSGGSLWAAHDAGRQARYWDLRAIREMATLREEEMEVHL